MQFEHFQAARPVWAKEELKTMNASLVFRAQLPACEAQLRLVGNYGMSCLVWDNGGDFRLIDREHLTAAFPEYVQAITQNPYRKEASFDLKS